MGIEELEEFWYTEAMTDVKWRQIRALACLIGTVIGAGIFGVPYVLSRTGVLVGVAYGVVITGVMIILNLYYANVVAAVRARHRYPGFAGIILGPWGKRIAGVIGVFGGWLAITAYVILGGTFLHLLLNSHLPLNDVQWSLIFAVVGAGIVGGGLGWVARIEVIMSSVLVAAILALTMRAAPEVMPAYLANFNSNYIFLPYGVLFFALSGVMVIPELEDMIGDGRRRRLRWVIILGTLIPALLTLAFGAVVAGVTGPETTPDALTGLKSVLGDGVIRFGAFFGILAIITSFLTYLMNQAEQFRYDYRMPPAVAWALSIGVPLAFFIFGARNFIDIIGLSGGVIGGLGGILVIMMYVRLKRQKRTRRFSLVLPIIVALFFIAGAIAELMNFFGG